jgi:hypothetical protein
MAASKPVPLPRPGVSRGVGVSVVVRFRPGAVYENQQQKNSARARVRLGGEVMSSLSKAWVTPVSILIVALSGMASAWGQDTAQSRQVLDRIYSVNPSAVLQMAFDDPNGIADFTNLGLVPVTGITTCQPTPINGLFCLDGSLVRNWPDTAVPTNVVTVFSCADPALALDTNKPPCTAMTADLAGNIWIAGRKSNKFRLIKVVPKDGTCPVGSGSGQLTNSPNYCFRVFVTDRPEIVNLVAIDGSAGADFTFGPGVLGLEGKSAVFYGDSPGDPPIVIASSQGWNLIGNEQVLSAALFQLKSGTSVDNYVLATTSTGRVLRKNTASTAAAVPVFNIPAERVLPPGQCDASTQRYGIRVSSQSGFAYVTDHNFCQVIALRAKDTDNDGVPDEPFIALENVPEGSADLTLSTQSFPPDAPTITPGIFIELRDCGENQPRCNLGSTAAQLTGVILDNGTPSGMTLFQIKGIPDCRDLPTNAFCLEKIAEESQGGQQVIVGPAGNRSEQYLNVTPLLPEEIKALFDDSGEAPNGLPPMLISPLYRGQAPDSIFEGLFGLTDPDIRFRGAFTGEFHVEELVTGNPVDSRCGLEPNAPQPNLNWDVVTMVSERYSSVGGPTGVVVDIPGPGEEKEHVDMLVNSDCNHTVLAGGRWSLYSYNLEVAPSGDSVFAKLLDSIYNDLEATRALLVCANGDADAGGDVAPLASGVCSTLLSRWNNGRTKLDDCINASMFPKQSQAVRNCEAFATQLTNYQTTLNGAVRAGIDPANRIGEQKARVAVVFEVFQHFLNSVPTLGFRDLFVP